ncbi:MAG: T9SS type A sorting domain-containing protein [Candidatus Marinimicrobia bacterium]|nr:T9SS type A sorting domain-containing protein [Candidatus Neomarinimicrobiota bacterium]
MNKSIQNFIIMPLLLVLWNQSALARNFRVNQIPNGSENGCANCHVNPAGGGSRNEFGSAIESGFLDGSGNVTWNATLAAMDSDGDGFSNGHELEDPFGLWSIGSVAPGTSTLVTFPGNASSVPQGIGADLSMQLHFTNFAPHLGQLFQVRVELSSTGEQIAFEEVAAISEAAFDVTFMHILVADETYDIEYWADFNGNGSYDAPPGDHAWRNTASNISGDQSLALTHNTNWVDIGNPVSLDLEHPAPTVMTLLANFPNPFNPETTISFFLNEAQAVDLKVYDMQGNFVNSLYSGFAQPGQHDFRFDARGAHGEILAAGIYFYRLKTNLGVQTQRMTLLK